MTTYFTVLAIILGSSMGFGLTYRYFKRKEKQLIKQFEENHAKDMGRFDEKINTLKSEGTDQPKKVEEALSEQKKGSIKDPASTPKK